MVYILIPIGLVIAFTIYLLYLIIVKKNLKANLQPVIFPALLFISVWSVIYFLILK